MALTRITSENIAPGTVEAVIASNNSFIEEKILPFDLAIAPEVLEINVAAPGAGNDIEWLWTWTQSTLPYARINITNSPQLSVPLYRQGTYQINNFANEMTGEMDQRHGLFLKWIDGAGLDNLVVWANNAGNTVHSHPNINGGANTTVQRINVSVPNTVNLPVLVSPSPTYNVSFVTTGAYTFSGAGVGNNRNIGPIYRGSTVTFNLDASLANHPFYLTTDNGTNFVSNAYFGEYTTGVTGSRNNGSSGQETLVFQVPNTAPSVLYYQCGVHSSMRGAITIRNLEVETNANGNPVLYFQHHKEGHKTPVEIRPIPSLVNQMCIVYDQTAGKFVPQDMATYVENTPSFKKKIQEVAGTATFIAPDGIPVVASVTIVEDASYLPLVGNKEGDISYSEDTDSIFIWNGSAWKNTKTSLPTNVAKRFLTLNVSGNLTIPFTGVSRAYPTANIQISSVYASLGNPSSSNLVFVAKKNGESVGTFTIPANSNRLSSTNTNISLTANDYLTVDISAGANASHLKVDFEFTYL